jgi:subtilisin family serine protease
MHMLSLEKQVVELEELPTQVVREDGRLALRAAGAEDRRLSRALGAFFGMRAALGDAAEIQREPPPAVFRERESQLLRVVHKEIVLHFEEGVSSAAQKKILKSHDLEAVAQSEFTPQQFVVRCKQGKRHGAALVPLANELTELAEIVFATPNFVSEYRRDLHKEQWHLKNTARHIGQKKGEDVQAEAAWKITQGKSTIVVAVLDDGVDLSHPSLKKNIRKKPNSSDAKDKFGRDFFLPNTHPEHYDPSPKLFQFPYDQMAGNDIHGTPCAGVIAASGATSGVVGIAPKCKVLAVKIFHADSLAADERVADAIRYAARYADVVSCSWSGGASPNVELALRDAALTGRGGKGTAVFVAAGNGSGSPVGFPARSQFAIAVSASTDQGILANYSNVGPQIWVAAPSSGGVRGVYTTDVSLPNRGFNTGNAAAGGVDGLHTNDFGGTSSATPLAAGVAALMLSANGKLTVEQIKTILKDTSDRIGADHHPQTGHSPRFGYGRVNAKAAVAKAKTL